LATCSSEQSRNRAVEAQPGRGHKIDESIAEVHRVAEGLKTCSVVTELAEEVGIEMPIAHEVYGVVHEERTARQAYRGLIRTRAGSGQEPD